MTRKKMFFLFLFLVAVVFAIFFIQSADRETIENKTIKAKIIEREGEKEIVKNSCDPITEKLLKEETLVLMGGFPITEEVLKEKKEWSQKSAASRGLITRKILEEEPEKKLIQKGVASWYGDYFHGRVTANGETYNMYELTAAHKELEFGTIVRVTHLANGKSVDVRINDRGPFIEGRIIDLSMQAAQEIGMKEEGIADVKMKIISSP